MRFRRRADRAHLEGRRAHPAHYDDSPANKDNPDPRATVHYGDQTWDEMAGYFSYTIDSQTQRRNW